MFRMFGTGDCSQDNESTCYARAFGEESIFGRKNPILEANEKPEDELSSETRANRAVAEGLLSSIFGNRP